MIYLYHIRKTGGRSLILSVLQLFDSDPVKAYLNLCGAKNCTVTYGGKRINGHVSGKLANVFFAFSHTPYYGVSLPPESFKISIFRDPVSRVKSYYQMLREIVIGLRNGGFVHRNAPDLAWYNDDFDKFLDKCPPIRISRQTYMFSASLDVSEAADRIGRLNFICRTEDLNDKLPELGGILGLDLKPVHWGTSSKLEFTQSQLDRIRDMSSIDYKLLDAIGLSR